MTNTTDIEYEKVACKVCSGKGKISASYGLRWKQCPKCKGCKYRYMPRSRTEICSFCDDDGLYVPSDNLLIRKECPYCDAFGKVEPIPPPSGTEDGPLVFRFQAGKPHSATEKIESFFERLSGDVRICDPYYGTRTLVRLQDLLHCKSIRFLTQHPDTLEGKTHVLPTAVIDYQKEHQHVTFRRYSDDDIHDRYILADQTLIILGHGLKDAGNKESFLIQLPKDVLPDLFDHLTDAFEKRWAQAKPLK